MKSGQHISHQFDEEIEQLKGSVLSMGGLVKEQLENAVKALLSNDKGLAENVVESDVHVNTYDVEIDERSTRLIALRQPAAIDLRLIMSVLKVTNDLERIGDEAKRIARLAMDVSIKGTLPEFYDSIEHMSVRVKIMLDRSLDAFARVDTEEAFKVINLDRKVDKEYENLMRQQITYMMEDPRSIPASLDLLWAAKALERIGDRSCNICEYIIYLVKGKDIRHIDIDELEDHLEH